MLVPEAEIEAMKVLISKAQDSLIDSPDTIGTATIEKITPAGYTLLIAAPEALNAVLQDREERILRETVLVAALERVRDSEEGTREFYDLPRFAREVLETWDD